MKQLNEYAVYDVPVNEILVDVEFNSRGLFSPQSVEELAQSISEHGLQMPVTVQPYEKAGYKYRLLAGHRRMKAVTTFLAWSTIPAMVREGLSEHEARLYNLMENLERKDLNIMEEALAIKHLYPNGIYIHHVAKELKRPVRWVNVRERLLHLPEKIQRWAAAGLLNATNLEAILKYAFPQEQIECAQGIIKAKREGLQGKDVPKKFKRSFNPRRTKTEMREMITQLYSLGLDGIPTRLLAWACGTISTDEIQQDLEEWMSQHMPETSHDD